MRFSFRKKARVTSVKVKPDQKLTLLLNGKIIDAYPKDLLSKCYHQIVSKLTGFYQIKIQGGGLSSQVQLVEQVLYRYLQEKDKVEIKKLFMSVDRTDSRRGYPKKYGGPNPRARYQKSYR